MLWVYAGYNWVRLISPAPDWNTGQEHRRGLLRTELNIERTSLLAAQGPVRSLEPHPDSPKPSVAWGPHPDQGHLGLVPTDDYFHFSLLKNGPCLRIHKT